MESEESEGGEVKLFRKSGELSTVVARFPIPITGANGVATIDLGDTPDIDQVTITINGSMGFDNLRFCGATPPPTELNCTFTQGYWKNHPEAWDVQSLTIGGISYNKAKLINILKTPPKKGNGVLILGHQLIAAKLNLANSAGASEEVTAAIAAADAKLNGINLQTGLSTCFRCNYFSKQTR